MQNCNIEFWLSEKVSELRRFIREADDTETLAMLDQVREDLEASRRRHRENFPPSRGRPIYWDFADDPGLAESLGADLGAIVAHPSR